MKINTVETCLNCENVPICQYYRFMDNNSTLINQNFNTATDSNSAIIEMFWELARRCKRFDKIEEG